MTVDARRTDEFIEWRTAVVDSRPVDFGVGGYGETVVFLHGWGLSPRAYRSALAAVVHRGYRVIAPALPGLGGTAELDRADRTFEGYAAWVTRFLDAAGVAGPVTVVGHSFGGGVATVVARDFPTRVSRLVLVNAVGGGIWSSSGGRERSIRERPWWSWCGSAMVEAAETAHTHRITQFPLDEFAFNALRNVGAVWRTGNLARTADLIDALEEIAVRAMPVVVLWGAGDRVIPRASFDAVCAALHDPEVREVRGNHNWPIDDAELFGQVLTEELAGRDVNAPVLFPSLASCSTMRIAQ
ncbi:alpha/beta fold hydrolase [Rhodococcus sp. NPDC059969]|uniref:alpha/beta fold hydrolase n=1 Tax=Rhodococcus sp. NPDC059969 TaxID=3347018 RepID=UPI003672BC92